MAGADEGAEDYDCLGGLDDDEVVGADVEFEAFWGELALPAREFAAGEVEEGTLFAELFEDFGEVHGLSYFLVAAKADGAWLLCDIEGHTEEGDGATGDVGGDELVAEHVGLLAAASKLQFVGLVC